MAHKDFNIIEKVEIVISIFVRLIFVAVTLYYVISEWIANGLVNAAVAAFIAFILFGFIEKFFPLKLR